MSEFHADHVGGKSKTGWTLWPGLMNSGLRQMPSMPTLSSANAAASEWRTIVLISSFVGLFAVGVGGTPVLLAVHLASQGQGAIAVGVSAAAAPLGIFLASFVIASVTHRIRATHIALACCGLGIAALAAMALAPYPFLWFGSRVVWGFGVGGFYILNKAWLAQLTPPSRRGQAFGLYGALLSAGFATGPLLVSALNFQPLPCFAVLAFSFAAAAFGVRWQVGRLPDFTGMTRLRVIGVLPSIVVALLAAAIFGFFDHVTLAFLPMYGLARGTSAAALGVGLSFLNVGNLLFQPVIGCISDHCGRRPTIIGCALLASLGAWTLPFVIATPLLYPFLLVWGACAFGAITVAFAAISDGYRGSRLLACSAAMTMAGASGGMVGPPIVGWAQAVAGPQALVHILAGAFFFLTVMASVLPIVRGASCAESCQN